MKKELIIKNESGLHVRDTAEFVRLAALQQCEVILEKDNKKANAKSILGVLSLGIVKGDVINIIVKGPKEEEVLEELAHFIENLKS